MRSALLIQITILEMGVGGRSMGEHEAGAGPQARRRDDQPLSVPDG